MADSTVQASPPMRDPWPEIEALKTLLAGLKNDCDALKGAFAAMSGMWVDARQEADLARDAYAYRAAKHREEFNKAMEVKDNG